MLRRHWRFLVPILVQVLLLAAVPAQKVVTRSIGTTVLLKLAPVDPYDLLSGHYLRLAYEVSRPPGIEAYADGQTVHVRLTDTSEGHWEVSGVYERRPTPLKTGDLWMRGRVRRGVVRYGIESYFIPETDREALDKDIREHIGEARAEVKVDDDGRAALVRLYVGDRAY